jgi:membrane protein YqaA with SNARE-associated domain
MLNWARHKYANYYLMGVSFAEASFFPLPPDVMLAPMIMARPHDTWRLAGITAISSVMGGMVGYLVGYFAYDLIGHHIIEFMGLQTHYQSVVSAFEFWGAWIILLAGIIPIPYKLFTMTAGVSAMPFFPFVLASMIGRSLRFFLVSSLIRLIGPKLEKHLANYLDYFVWGLIAVLVISFGLLKFR